MFGVEAVAREDGGAGGDGRVEGRENGVKTVADDDGALWITLTLTAGAAGRVVCRMD